MAPGRQDPASILQFKVKRLVSGQRAHVSMGPMFLRVSRLL